MVKRCLAVAASLLLPAFSQGQVLAQKLPADAMIYVGWRGASAPGSQYAGSHLESILNATDLTVLSTDAFAQSLARLVAREDRSLGRQVPAILGAAKEMLRYPTALYVTASPQPGGALIADVGENAPGLAQKITALQQGRRSALRVSVHGRYLCLDIGASQPLFDLLDGKSGATLAAALDFVAGMKQVDKEGTFVAYVDVAAILAAGGKSASPRDAAEARRLMSAIGADGIQRLSISGGFAGKDWQTKAFADAPLPRQGLARLLDAKPLSDALFKNIPQSATFVTMKSLDLASLMDELRASLVRYDTRLGAQYDQALAQATQIAGVDLRKDLIGQFGSEWAIYCDPAVTGTGYLSLVLLNRPANPTALETSLLKVEQALATMASQQMQRNRMVLPLYEKMVGSNRVHCLALPFVSPSWCVRDGVFYLGLYPQTTAAAADAGAAVSTGKPAIAGQATLTPSQLPAYQAIVREFPQGLSSYTFTDLPRTAASSYNMTLFWTRYAAIADLMGLETPAVALPPLPTLLAHLSPAVGGSWSDAAGWHYVGRSPFPGSVAIAGVLNGDITGVQAPIMASILLPSLARARENANMVKCASNLRQVGLGIMMYANENRGQCPPDLGTLVETQGLSLQVFQCPSSATALPDEVLGGALDAQSRWVSENGDYVYLGAGKKQSALKPDEPLAYEKHSHYGKVNILFGDGHVEARPQEMMPQRAK